MARLAFYWPSGPSGPRCCGADRPRRWGSVWPTWSHPSLWRPRRSPQHTGWRSLHRQHWKTEAMEDQNRFTDEMNKQYVFIRSVVLTWAAVIDCWLCIVKHLHSWSLHPNTVNHCICSTINSNMMTMPITPLSRYHIHSESSPSTWFFYLKKLRNWSCGYCTLGLGTGSVLHIHTQSMWLLSVALRRSHTEIRRKMVPPWPQLWLEIRGPISVGASPG